MDKIMISLSPVNLMQYLPNSTIACTSAKIPLTNCICSLLTKLVHISGRGAIFSAIGPCCTQPQPKAPSTSDSDIIRTYRDCTKETDTNNQVKSNH